MRLFIAIDTEERIRQQLAQFVDELRRAVPEARFSRVEGLHITLKFLGETDKLDGIRNALAPVRGPAIPIEVIGTGFFPSARRPRVFWAGVNAPTSLAQLAFDIDGACAAVGFASETRAFTPHLTLAREGTGNPHAQTRAQSSALSRIAEMVSSRPQPDFGKMIATQFHIYESKLHPKGAIYTKLASFGLTSQE
jgi:RNA 2',3'-cyclic 3'-phosphodiesterase